MMDQYLTADELAKMLRRSVWSIAHWRVGSHISSFHGTLPAFRVSNIMVRAEVDADRRTACSISPTASR
jgi:hypothetical protein